jgi:hypothetical protein
VSSNDWTGLRAMTATTGGVHEAQVLQLKMWGAIAFPNRKWEAAVDVRSKTVTYKLTKGQKQRKALAKRVAVLDRSIHWLLGDNWALNVDEDGNLLYQGQRKLPDTNEQRKSRRTV